jgi:hypothetical protein
MAQEKTFDRADLLRFFHETASDGMVGRVTVVHPPTPAQLSFDQDASQGEVRRYPVIAETTALYCERYGFSVVVQRVEWPDGGNQYLGRDHPLRTLTRDRRVVTRYGGNSAQLGRWATELADAFKDEVKSLVPSEPIRLYSLRENPLVTVVLVNPPAEPEPEPDQANESDGDPDPDHDATGQTMDDLLRGLGEEGAES